MRALIWTPLRQSWNEYILDDEDIKILESSGTIMRLNESSYDRTPPSETEHWHAVGKVSMV